MTASPLTRAKAEADGWVFSEAYDHSEHDRKIYATRAEKRFPSGIKEVANMLESGVLKAIEATEAQVAQLHANAAHQQEKAALELEARAAALRAGSS